MKLSDMFPFVSYSICTSCTYLSAHSNGQSIEFLFCGPISCNILHVLSKSTCGTAPCRGWSIEDIGLERPSVEYPRTITIDVRVRSGGGGSRERGRGTGEEERRLFNGFEGRVSVRRDSQEELVLEVLGHWGVGELAFWLKLMVVPFSLMHARCAFEAQ